MEGGIHSLSGFQLCEYSVHCWLSLQCCLQEEFQALFLDYETSVQFHYFKKFRSARVEFDSVVFASQACCDLHDHSFMGSNIKCHFAQVTAPAVSVANFVHICRKSANCWSILFTFDALSTRISIRLVKIQFHHS